MPTLSTKARNAAVTAIAILPDEGSGAGALVFRTSGNSEVATLAFSDPAFGAASTGTVTAAAISPDTSATGGTTTKATFEDSDAELMLTVTVGTSGSEINLSSTTIGPGDTVSMTSLTMTMPAS